MSYNNGNRNSAGGDIITIIFAAVIGYIVGTLLQKYPAARVIAALLFIVFGIAALTASAWGWGLVFFGIAAAFLVWAHKPIRTREAAAARFAAFQTPESVEKFLVGKVVTQGPAIGWSIAIAHAVPNTFRATQGHVWCDVDLILANSEAVSAAFYADTNTDQWSWTTRGASYSPGGDEPVGERNSRSIPQDVKVAVSARDGGKCRLCGSTEDIQFDHIIPWSKGGAATVANIQLLCGFHNRQKSDHEAGL